MFDNFFGWFALIFYVLPLVLVLPLIKKRRLIVNQLLENQALKRNGLVKKILGIPYYLGFQLNDQPVSITLSAGGKNSPPTTAFMAEVDFLNSFDLNIGSEHALSKLGKKFGKNDVQVMNPEFDDAFLIRGKDENRLRALLTSEVQAVFQKWKASYPNLNIQGRKIRFSIGRMIREDEELDEFIDSASFLFSKILDQK